MDIQFELDEARSAIQQGDHSKARSILRKVLEQSPRNVDAWLLFADAAQKTEHTIQCLDRVLILDPGNAVASARLEQLQSVPSVDFSLEQEQIPAAPVELSTRPSIQAPSLSPQPIATAQTTAPALPLPTTKRKPSFSGLEKLLIAILGVLSLCVLVVLGYIAFGGGLSSLSANRSSPTQTDYAAVVYENIRASNAEEKQAYMATIHPDSPAYKTTEETLDTIFNNFDLSYKVSNVAIVEENSHEVKLTFTLVTRKIRGAEFRDNQIDGIIILRKDGDVWKIYNQTVENIKYLD